MMMMMMMMKVMIMVKDQRSKILIMIVMMEVFKEKKDTPDWGPGPGRRYLEMKQQEKKLIRYCINTWVYKVMTVIYLE